MINASRIFLLSFLYADWLSFCSHVWIGINIFYSFEDYKDIDFTPDFFYFIDFGNSVKKIFTKIHNVAYNTVHYKCAAI